MRVPGDRSGGRTGRKRARRGLRDRPNTGADEVAKRVEDVRAEDDVRVVVTELRIVVEEACATRVVGADPVVAPVGRHVRRVARLREAEREEGLTGAVEGVRRAIVGEVEPTIGDWVVLGDPLFP